MCSRYVKEVGIDSVLALEDVAAPILSSLVEKYGSFAFCGPTFESVFLTINKYYTRKLLDPNPVPYCHIDLNSYLESATLENLFDLNSKSSSNSYSMYRKGTYLAYNNNVTKDGPCKKILCLYTDKRYDYIVRLSSAYLCDQNNVISLRHELLQYYCNGRFDLLKSAEMCSRYVKEVGIDSVLALEDVAAPILSSLVEKYGSFAFRGPSFESVFLTINKYYTRKLLDPNPVPYCHIDLNSHLESATLENMLNEVGLPAILKPACGTGSVLIQKINSFDDLLYAIESSKKHYSSVIGSHAPLSCKFLDLSRYPLALTDRLMILEKYVDGEIIELDGYVFNGKAYRWALYDLTTWPTHPNVNQMLFLPSTKPTHIQDRIWDMFETVANRAADYGYDNHFMNMQLFLCKNGDVRLLEINGRMTTVCSPLCQKSLTSGDTIEAQLRLAQGDKPPPAKFTGVHSAYVSIRSTISGKADEIIDFQVAESMENVNLHTGPDDYIQPVGDGGKSVGGAYLFADSREEIWQKHRDLYKRLFKKHPIGLSN